MKKQSSRKNSNETNKIAVDSRFNDFLFVNSQVDREEYFTKFDNKKKLELISVGRLVVDLYSKQLGANLEDANSFAKYLGGSSANIAFGASRLGLNTAMISRVGDEQHGRFLKKTLTNEGCDISQIQTDKNRLTALVFLGIKDRKNFPLLFYRENCADLAIDINLIDKKYIANAKAMIFTGTVLANANGRKLATELINYAKSKKTVVTLDIDYRPVLWGLTRLEDGENRFVSNKQVSKILQEFVNKCDILIGTEEEFLIAGGKKDLLSSLKNVRQKTSALLILKLGAKGSSIISADIPKTLAELTIFPGEKIAVKNVLGAGDAFAAGLMFGLLRGKSFSESAKIANACGALTASRHGCSLEMPTIEELQYYFASKAKGNFDTGQLNHLHRVTVKRKKWDELYVLAFDHRKQFYQLAKKYPDYQNKISEIKLLLVEAVVQIEKKLKLQNKIGVLIDENYGADALALSSGRNWWVGRPVEIQLSRPLSFEKTYSLASILNYCPIEQVIKCLIYYHPQDEVNLRLAQEERLQELWDATRKSGHELLLEVILPQEKNLAQDESLYPQIIKRFYNLGIKPEWWKLPPLAKKSWDKIANEIKNRDIYCRGIVILGLNRRLTELVNGFYLADNPIIKGFMVGRSIWQEPVEKWFSQKNSQHEFISTVCTNFETLYSAWQKIHFNR